MMKTQVTLLALTLVATPAMAERPAPFEAMTWQEVLDADYVREGCHMWWKGTGECKWVHPEGKDRINCYFWGVLNPSTAVVACNRYPIIPNEPVNATNPSRQKEHFAAVEIIHWNDALELEGAEPGFCYHEMRAQACRVEHEDHDWSVVCQQFQHSMDRLACRFIPLR